MLGFDEFPFTVIIESISIFKIENFLMEINRAKHTHFTLSTLYLGV